MKWDFGGGGSGKRWEKEGLVLKRGWRILRVRFGVCKMTLRGGLGWDFGVKFKSTGPCLSDLVVSEFVVS